MRYPFSAGDTAAGVTLPAGACDCHLHVYDARVPAAPGATLLPPDASVGDYRRVQARMGTTRAVLVTPSTYGTDNTPMLAGLAQLGPDGRGVAVLSGDEDEAHLHRLHQAGVRGARVNLSLGVVNDAASITRIARRIAPLGWHLQLLMPVAAALPQVKAGKLRALAVTSAARLKVLPEVPTMAEAGQKDFVVEQWQGVYLPARTPAAVVQRLNAEINKALRDPAVTELADKLGVTLVGGTPKALADVQAADSATWARVIRTANIKAD